MIVAVVGVVLVLAIAIFFTLGGKPQAGSIPDPDNSAERLEGSESGKSRAATVTLSAEELYSRASSGVVTITCKNDLVETIGSGSGFFVKDELVHDPRNEMHERYAEFVSKQEGRPLKPAFLLTNYHVIEAAVEADIALSDGSRGHVAEVTTEDESADLALLSVFVYSSTSPTRLPLADNTPDVGTTVYAIGSPRGLANSLSTGIVSGIRENEPRAPWLQTTASISPGSSGGPLLTPNAHVVGLTTAYFQNSQNLNIAIPVSELRRFLNAPYRGRKLWEGRSLFRREDDEFARQLGRGVGLRNDHPAVPILKARSQVLDKKYEEAIQTLSDAMPSIPRQFRYLAHFILAEAQYRLAKKLAVRGRTVDDSYRNFRNSEHAEKALEFLKESARLNSKFAPTYALLADYHFSAGEWAEGLVAADSLLKLMPKCAKAYLERGGFFLKLHRAKSALEDFQVALKLNPRDFYVHEEIGDAWFDLQEYEKSIDSYKTALSMKPFDPGYCHYRIGNAYQEAGKYQQAILAYEKARNLGFDAEPCDLGISICRERMR